MMRAASGAEELGSPVDRGHTRIHVGHNGGGFR